MIDGEFRIWIQPHLLLIRDDSIPDPDESTLDFLREFERLIRNEAAFKSRKQIANYFPRRIHQNRVQSKP